MNLLIVSKILKFLSNDFIGGVGLHLYCLCLCLPPILRHDPLQRPDDHSGNTNAHIQWTICGEWEKGWLTIVSSFYFRELFSTTKVKRLRYAHLYVCIIFDVESKAFEKEYFPAGSIASTTWTSEIPNFRNNLPFPKPICIVHLCQLGNDITIIFQVRKHRL